MAAALVIYCSRLNSVNVASPAVTELQGTYSGSLSGSTSIDDTTYIFTFAKDTVTLQNTHGQDTTLQFSGIFVLDTAVSPNQITIRIVHSVTAQQVGLTDSAIFAFSGNVLKISANAPGTARPSAFDGTFPYYNLIR
jgi:uncharacterized protein (TIGR03067 family)